jgi:hypothetical protein
MKVIYYLFINYLLHFFELQKLASTLLGVNVAVVDVACIDVAVVDMACIDDAAVDGAVIDVAAVNASRVDVADVDVARIDVGSADAATGVRLHWSTWLASLLRVHSPSPPCPTTFSSHHLPVLLFLRPVIVGVCGGR